MTDRRVIERLLRVERGAVRLYEVIVPEVRGEAAAAARHFLAQERRHVDALEQALRTMEVPVPDAVAPVPEPAGGPRDLIRVAAEHERTCISAYLSAQSQLKAPALLGGAAGTMANEAQHLAYLRGLLDDQPVPVAFVTGR
jgi:plasmid stability protein